MPLIPMVVQFTVEEVRGFRRRMTCGACLLVVAVCASGPMTALSALGVPEAWARTIGNVGVVLSPVLLIAGLWLLYSAWARIRDPIRVHEVTRPENLADFFADMDDKPPTGAVTWPSEGVDLWERAAVMAKVPAAHESVRLSLLRRLLTFRGFMSLKPPPVELDPANARRVVIVDAGEHDKAGRLLGMLVDENTNMMDSLGSVNYSVAMRTIRGMGERTERAEAAHRNAESTINTLAADLVKQGAALAECQRLLKAAEAECLQRANALNDIQQWLVGTGIEALCKLTGDVTITTRANYTPMQAVPDIERAIRMLGTMVEVARDLSANARLRAKKAKKRPAKKAGKR